MGRIQRFSCSKCTFDSGALLVGPGFWAGSPTNVVVSCTQCGVITTLPRDVVDNGCPVHHVPLGVFPGYEGPVPCPKCATSLARLDQGVWD